MTWGELAMLIAPRQEAIGRRIQRDSGDWYLPARQLGGHGLVRRERHPEVCHGPRRSSKQPAPEFFGSVQDFTRRQVYEAFRG